MFLLCSQLTQTRWLCSHATKYVVNVLTPLNLLRGGSPKMYLGWFKLQQVLKGAKKKTVWKKFLFFSFSHLSPPRGRLWASSQWDRCQAPLERLCWKLTLQSKRQSKVLSSTFSLFIILSQTTGIAKVRPQKKLRDYLGIFPIYGGVFPIPKTFVNGPSIFLCAKFILKC